MPIVFASNAQNLLNGSQKIVNDAPRNRLLVSNYNDGNLVVIDSTGNQTLFVPNADFVDGLEIIGDTIFGVGNNRYIHAYNLETRELLWNKKIPGTNYLSSMASDSAGHLFIPCPVSNIIYKLRISDQAYWVFDISVGNMRRPGFRSSNLSNRYKFV